MLDVKGVDAGYGAVQVLHDVTLRVERREIVSLVGSNGAGKTTLLMAISGIMPIGNGQISLDGSRIDTENPWEITERGLVQVAQNRLLFPLMTVMENLELGAYTRRGRERKGEALETVFKLFPVLKQRYKQRAGTLSGGEQQMLAVGRALMAQPELLMLDEPSFGLAPKLQLQIFDIIRNIHEQGVTVLIVEQNVYLAMRTSDRGYVLENGRIVLEGDAQSLLENDRVKEAYLGV